MSNTPEITMVKIETADEFNEACEKYGVSYVVGKRKPFKALALAIRNTPMTVIIDTPFFYTAMATGAHLKPRGVKAEITYAVAFAVVSEKTNKPGKPRTLVLSEDDILSATPHVKGRVGHARATMALSAKLGIEWPLIAVEDVKRIETAPIDPALIADENAADEISAADANEVSTVEVDTNEDELINA